jgi:hypothetical protein
MTTHIIGLKNILGIIDRVTTNQHLVKLADSLTFSDGINQDVGLYVEKLEDKLNFIQNVNVTGVKYKSSLSQNIAFTQNIRRVYEKIIVDHLHFTQTADRSFQFVDGLIFSESIRYDNGTYLPDKLVFIETVNVNHKYGSIIFTDILVFTDNTTIYVIPTRGHQGL